MIGRFTVYSRRFRETVSNSLACWVGTHAHMLTAHRRRRLVTGYVGALKIFFAGNIRLTSARMLRPRDRASTSNSSRGARHV